MSQDEGGSFPSFTQPEMRELPKAISRAILDCAAAAKCKKEFEDMVYGVDQLNYRLCEEGIMDIYYQVEIQAMADDIYKYLPDELEGV